MTDFFESKKAAAIFKHAVLDKYVNPFVMKTGSTSTGKRVGFVDGYAGEGRYADGKEGSPALLLRKANEMRDQRIIECSFVEADKDAYASLEAVINNEGAGVAVELRRGDIQDHLDEVLEGRKGVPLFMFLDPYGLSLPFDTVTKVFARPGGLGAPATEVLINFTAVGLRRIAGMLYSSAANAEATLARMDTMCGGDWWRDEWLKHAPLKTSSPESKRHAEEAVVSGYARRLATKAKAGTWIAEVQNRAHHLPVYYLVFISRHPDGMALFGESLSLASEVWRREIFKIEQHGTLFDSDESFADEEKALTAAWQAEIGANVQGLLKQQGAFVISERYAEVYGSALGKAREKHVRAALKALLKDDVIAADLKGDLLPKRIAPGPNL